MPTPPNNCQRQGRNFPKGSIYSPYASANITSPIAIMAGHQRSSICLTVQLVLSDRDNGHHRAEVAKLMVHTSRRGHGLGRALLSAAHVEARFRGRTLLILDTRTGDAGEKLYESMGYTRSAQIPGYTMERDGSMHGTTFFYHVLP